jgi:hypothetical protein
MRIDLPGPTQGLDGQPKIVDVLKHCHVACFAYADIRSDDAARMTAALESISQSEATT